MGREGFEHSSKSGFFFTRGGTGKGTPCARPVTLTRLGI